MTNEEKDKIIDNVIAILQQMERNNEDPVVHSKEEWLEMLKGDLKNV